MQHRQVVSWPSLCVAGLCFSITIGVLFADVIEHGITVNHLYILMGLIIALAALEIVAQATGMRRFVFLLLGSVATIMSVGVGGGRSSAQIELQEMQYKSQLDAFRELQKRITRDDKRLIEYQVEYQQRRNVWQKAVDESTEKCKAQYGITACKSANSQRDKAKDDLEAKQHEIDTLEQSLTVLREQLVKRQPQRDNQVLRGISNLIALIFFIDEERAFELFKKLYPYLVAFMGEGGTVAFFNNAWGVKRREQETSMPPEAPVTIGDIARDLKIEPRLARKLAREHNIPKPAHGQWSWTRAEAEEIKSKIGPRTLN